MAQVSSSISKGRRRDRIDARRNIGV